MATTPIATAGESRWANSVSIIRLAVAGGATAAIVFVLCWLGTFVSFSSPTHAYIGLFTNADINSPLALVEGACWSLIFGALVGAVFALVYNATAIFGRD